MKRVALVKDGITVNVCIVDDDGPDDALVSGWRALHGGAVEVVQVDRAAQVQIDDAHDARTGKFTRATLAPDVAAEAPAEEQKQ